MKGHGGSGFDAESWRMYPFETRAADDSSVSYSVFTITVTVPTTYNLTDYIYIV